MPKFLEDADCRLTLYRNCRNTENIAKTSLRPITDRSPRLMENCIVGVPAKLQFCSDDESVLRAVNSTLDTLWRDGYEDIVILTCRKETDSLLYPHTDNGCYRYSGRRLRFSTCRKFKGLEADAVILLDVDEETFLGNSGQNILLYYVGASRARLRLHIVTVMDNDSCVRILEHMGRTGKIRQPKRDLAKALNALPVTELS